MIIFGQDSGELGAPVGGGLPSLGGMAPNISFR